MITLFEPGRVRLDADLLEHTSQGHELFARMGDRMGSAGPRGGSHRARVSPRRLSEDPEAHGEGDERRHDDDADEALALPHGQADAHHPPTKLPAASARPSSQRIRPSHANTKPATTVTRNTSRTLTALRGTRSSPHHVVTASSRKPIPAWMKPP